MAKVGLGFVAAITLFAMIQFYFEDDNQKDSFAAARASISNLSLERPITQRQSKLLKINSKYSWRAIIWVRDGAVTKPKIWHAIVIHEGKSFRCLSSLVFDYRKDDAWALELFDDVSAGPPLAR